MNTIKHEDVLDFINSAEHIAHNFTTEELEEVDSTSLILGAIQTVAENAPEWVDHIELAITPKGYEIRYEPAESVVGMDMDHIVHDLLARGLEVMNESLWGN